MLSFFAIIFSNKLLVCTAHFQQRRYFGKGLGVGNRRLIISNVAAADITTTEQVISCE
jgi:hypothetical protein